MIISVYEISPTEWMTTQRLYLTWYPMYLCNQIHLLMTSQPMYVWNHTHCMHDTIGTLYDITSILYDITPRYDIHIHCIHVITPRIPVVASTVAELLLTVYWLEDVCNMYDIKPLYIWHHMNSMWHLNHSFWHQKTVFMTSHPYYSLLQTHCIRHAIHYTCDITATVTMTRHLLCFWHDPQRIWDLTRWMNDKTTTVSDMITNVSV